MVLVRTRGKEGIGTEYPMWQRHRDETVKHGRGRMAWNPVRRCPWPGVDIILERCQLSVN